MDLLYGRLTKITEVKASENGWYVEGYASTFGNIDHGGDVVVKGAFDATLASNAKVRFLFGHSPSSVLGSVVDLKADDVGLWGRFAISKTTLGADVHTLLQDGALDSFSIGYIPVDSEWTDDGVRLLKQIDLLEVSIVPIPMNDAAVVTGVKAGEKAVWSTAYINDLPDSAFAIILPGGKKDDSGRTTPRTLRKLPHHNAAGDLDMAHLRNALSREPQTDLSDTQHAKAKNHLQRHMNAAKHLDELLDTDVSFADLMTQLTGWLDYGAAEAEALLERRGTEERKLADAHIAAITSMLGTAEAVKERLEAVIAGPPPAGPAINVSLELARRRLRNRGILTEESPP